MKRDGVPYKYGVTLGLTSLLKPNKINKVNSKSGVFAWPVPDKQQVSYLYGYSAAYGTTTFHNGVDISIQAAEVIAAADGTVIRNTNNISNGTFIANSYGNVVILEHTIGSEKFQTLYAHMAQGSTLKVGDTVKKGDLIGITDTTGSSTGYHLHYGMFKDLNGDGSINITSESIDPITYYNVVPNTELDPNIPQYSELVANPELAKTAITKQDSYLVVSSKGGYSGAGAEDMEAMLGTWEGCSPIVVQNGIEYYVIESDGAGHETVGVGVDIFNGGFAEIFEANGYPTHMGGLVPKDFVDALKEQELEQNRQEVISRSEGLNLTDYQMDAMVSRSYNCGPHGAFKDRGPEGLTFVEAYKKYWKESDTSSEVDFNHPLYVNYMQYPYTSNGKPLPGLVRRRKAEWILFQTGVYAANDSNITAD